MDPRRWDLDQMLSAYEVVLQQGAKDDAEWKRTRTRLYAEPAVVRKERIAAEREGVAQAAPAPQRGLSLGSVEALLAAAAAQDAQFGTGT